MKRLVINIALGLAAALILTAGGAFLAARHFLETPMNAATNSTQAFTIESGESMRVVAERLEQAGLVRWGEGFRLWGRYPKETLQAGEFELSAAMSPKEILNVLAHGQPMLHRLQFAEGLTMREVAQIVDATGLTTAARFLAACRDRDFLRQRGINATDAEGYLFPETYFFPRIPKQDPYPILQALLDRFADTVRDLPQGDPEELHRTLILASLVEKETAVPAERGTVAGVYANRLKRGMLLQCDPTIIYGLGETFDGNLKRFHLTDAANLYNTYVHPGLPPGPICSPGKAALEAATRPDQHDFLYFVARQDGTHHFSRTLNEHTNAVIKYQRRGRPMPTSSDH